MIAGAIRLEYFNAEEDILAALHGVRPGGRLPASFLVGVRGNDSGAVRGMVDHVSQRLVLGIQLSICSAISNILVTLFQFRAVPVTFRCFSTWDQGSFEVPTPFGK